MSELQIVTFGKYKDKPITELLADDKYVEWLKQQSWFTNQKTIYNIVVNQQINHPNLNSKTPEHNSLQNKFLDKNNRIKLIKKIINPGELKSYKKLKLLLNDENFIKNFGNYDINKIFHPEYKNDYEFEGKYNWDLIIKSIDNVYYDCEFIINLTNELDEKDKFKKEYDLIKKLKLNELKEERELKKFCDNYDKNFNNEYKEYRINKLKEIFSSFDNGNYGNHDINFKHDKLLVELSHYFILTKIFCEIKPLLSDDYPNVLRKMKTQITLQKELNQKSHFPGDRNHYIYVLILKEFVSNTVSKDQLIQIFDNSDIHIIFTDEIFDDENKILSINNSDKH